MVFWFEYMFNAVSDILQWYVVSELRNVSVEFLFSNHFTRLTALNKILPVQITKFTYKKVYDKNL